MLNSDIAFYVGAEKENGYSGYLAEPNYFLILEIEEGINPEQGREELQKIKQRFIKQAVTNMSDFEYLISGIIKEHHIPSGLSISAGYLLGSILYVKTIGTGCILLQRGNQFTKLIGANQVASGYIEDDDFFIFTTIRFIEKNNGEGELKKSLKQHESPHQAVENITPKIKSGDDQGLIALFARFKKQEEVMTAENIEELIEAKPEQKKEEPLFISDVKPWDKAIRSVQQLYVNTQNSMGGVTLKKKALTLVVVAILFVILVWSVGLGYTRRNDTAVTNKIKASRDSIQQKLNQADQGAFLDLPHALSLVADARSDLEQLKAKVPKSKQPDLDAIAALITNEENKIVKKENKSYDEFFDLQVDSKQAKGVKLYLDGDSLLILDNVQGTIYSLSLPKKSLTKQGFPEIKNAQLVTGSQGTELFYSGNGIYKISTDDKLGKVIDKDSDWNSIMGMWIYNGNLYLLDKGKDVYKYLVAENGYSAKSSYFKSGQGGSLQNANSLAIDSSVYIGTDDTIVKFTVGEPDDFKTTYPDSNVHIVKVYTTKESVKVYAWDRQKGFIYILGKDGVYEREISADILKQADDFIVYNNVAYVLYSSKIYSISL